MPKCAFLSTDNLEEFFVYDDMVKPYLRDLGWEVSDVSWKDNQVNFDQYQVVVVRSTWDYQDNVNGFLTCLDNIEKSNAVLENPYELMRWNISKDYLQKLSEKGIPVLPTLWFTNIDFDQIAFAFKYFECDEIVIKPQISANADFTYRLTASGAVEQKQELTSVFNNKPGLIQAFESSVVDEGEYSLFYFDGCFSHAILKTPESGDFRVQEEHGGSLRSIKPEQPFLNLADATLAALPYDTLYARIDIVKTVRGLEIIEVELIEPSLYFNMDKASAERFAKAINNKYNYFNLSGSMT